MNVTHTRGGQAAGFARLVAVGLLLTSVARAQTNRPGVPLAPKPLHIESARLFAYRLPREHISREPLNDQVAQRAWTNLIAALDYDRMFFLASDIARLRADIPTLDDALVAGDVSYAFRVYELYKERVNDRVAFVESLLEKDFDLTVEETYQWKRKQADWPADRAEWDDLWRRRIKNEYVSLMVAREIGAAEDESDKTVTIAPPGTTNAVAPPAAPTPRESILKRYRQVRILHQDNDADWVYQLYLSAFARAYDPHSDYFSPTLAEDFEIEMRLSLVGIGALLAPEDGAAKIVRLLPGGPAARDTREERLQPNDRIVAVAQGDREAVDVLHWPLARVVRLIRGEKGTTVVLTVIPASDPTGSTLKRVSLVRDEVKLEERAAASTLENGVGTNGVARRLGVVKLPEFYANMKVNSPDQDGYRSCADDVAAAISELKTRGIEGLVLDLRNNGGGPLIEAIRVTGLFIRSGPVVQAKEGLRVRVLPDLDDAVMYGGPLVVLVNRLSASASEIVAGALQDYGRALVVGDRKTHGKGTVQSIIELGDRRHGSVKITSAKYYRITGASTQLRGVTPDLVLSSPLDFMEVGEEMLPNVVAWSTISPAPYLPVNDLRALTPALTAASRARRDTNPRYLAYESMLRRVEEMNRNQTLPLEIGARRALARTEKELTDLQRHVDEDAAPDGGTNTPPDLVLQEALNILADLVTAQGTQAMGAGAAAPPRRPFSEALSEWFRESR